MKRFNTCSNIYYKEEIEAERKFYPRIKALLRVPFREVYRISRSTPFGRLRSCTSMYTPFDASRKITPDHR